MSEQAQREWMPDWYVYYRLLHTSAMSDNCVAERIGMGDILNEFRDRILWDFSDAKVADLEEFFNDVADNQGQLKPSELYHLMSLQTWFTPKKTPFGPKHRV